MQQAQRFGKSGGSVLRMTVFRKFEVCASYEHLWLNRHLRQAAKRCIQYIFRTYAESFSPIFSE